MEVQIEGPSLAHLTQDLRAVGTRLQRMVLVDNDAEVFFFQPDNGIPVEDYLGGVGADEELARVAHVLEELLFVKDVRRVLRRKFALRDLAQHGAIGVGAGPVLRHAVGIPCAVRIHDALRGNVLTSSELFDCEPSGLLPSLCVPLRSLRSSSFGVTCCSVVSFARIAVVV